MSIFSFFVKLIVSVYFKYLCLLFGFTKFYNGKFIIMFLIKLSFLAFFFATTKNIYVTIDLSTLIMLIINKQAADNFIHENFL